MDKRLRGAEPTSPEDASPLAYVVYGDPTEEAEIDWERVLTLWNLRLPWVWDYGHYLDTFDLLHQILARAQEVTATWGGRFVFVYLPSYHRFRGALGRIEAEAYRREVLAVVRSLELPLIDLTPVFERQESPSSLFEGHYSVEGNALVAKTVVRAVESGWPVD